MKAVNLIPDDQRRAGGGLLGDAGGATRALLGVLVLAIVVVVAHTLLSNGVAQRRSDLAGIEAQTRTLQAQAAALKPYGDVAELRARRVAAVRTLMGERFDWARLLGDVARVLPPEVTLVALTGTAPSATAATGAPAAPAAGAAPGPTIQVSGCTTDHRAVALTMERLRGVRGVADVQLASANTVGAPSSGSAGGGCPRRDQFQLALALAQPPAAQVAQ